MSWPTKIENLRKYVCWECREIPPDLVLAIIQHESGGRIGVMGKGHTKCGKIPDINGNDREVCVAMGLMQCIADTVSGYNKNQTDSNMATFEDMTGTDERAARIQIRVGCWFLAQANKRLHREFPDVFPAIDLSRAKNDQIAMVLTGYAVGPGNTAKKIQALQDKGVKPSFSALKKHFPDWGKSGDKWINNPLAYADATISQFAANRVDKPFPTSPGDLVARVKKKIDGRGMIFIAAVLAASGMLVHRYYITPKRMKQ